MSPSTVPVTAEDVKSRLVREVTDSETTWQLIFKHMDVPLLEGELAELEFRKALYRHKFDRQWYSEFQKIENEHYGIMGAILEFTRPTTPDALKTDPLTLSKNLNEYVFDIDLPYMKDTSDELMLMLCQRFRFLYAKEPS